MEPTKINNMSMAIAAAVQKAIFGEVATTNFKSNNRIFHGTNSTFKQNRRIQLKHGFKARGKQHV